MEDSVLTLEKGQPRRVMLLNTDERAGLVASLAAKCAERAVSLEISTGPGHVVLTFQADESTVENLNASLAGIDGVVNVTTYSVRETS